MDVLLRRIPEAILFAVAILGAFAAFRRHRWHALVIACFLVSYTLVYAAIVAVNVRYHLEVLWAETVFAAVGAVALAARFTADQTNDR